MAYHSSFNETECTKICGMSVLPIKLVSKARGPAQTQTGPNEDILDEAVNFFRANILFRNYEVKGPADRLLIYLTLYIHQCLIRLANKDKDSGLKALQALAIENFAIPGDKNFVLGGFCANPTGRQEADNCRQWFTQLRTEIAFRLVEQVYKDNPKVPSKWWVCWTKRKFLNKSLEGP